MSGIDTEGPDLPARVAPPCLEPLDHAVGEGWR